jgi:hypothetical protein
LGEFRAQMDDESVAAVGPSLLRYAVHDAGVIR